MATHDHTIVYKSTHEAKGTPSPSSQKLPAGVGAGIGVAKAGGHAVHSVMETVEDLEPDSTYEVR